MNADETRKAAAFMYSDISAKKQPALAPDYLQDNSGRCHKDKFVITFVGLFADMIFEGRDGNNSYDLYDQEDMLQRTQKGMEDRDLMQRVIVNREELIKLLQPMTSDWVMLKIADDYPVKICGEIGECKVAAYLAPRIE